MKFIKGCGFFIIIIFILVGLSTLFKDKDVNKTETKSSYKNIEPFGDPYQLRVDLSKIGIGELGMWKRYDDMGYMAITNYFQFGSEGRFMYNNISIYLTGTEEYCANELKVVLHVNNKKEYKDALRVFSEVNTEVFRRIKITEPYELNESIKNKKPGNFFSQSARVVLDVDKNKIDTWTLTIN